MSERAILSSLSMTGLTKTEQGTAWDLRSAWAERRRVRLTLTERSMIRTVVGRVAFVSVTGAFAVIDGWHVPCADVLAVGKPTVEDGDAYAAELERLALAEGAQSPVRA